MSNSDIVLYIQKAREKGADDSTITQILISDGGWEADEVSEAFREANEALSADEVQSVRMADEAPEESRAAAPETRGPQGKPVPSASPSFSSSPSSAPASPSSPSSQAGSVSAGSSADASAGVGPRAASAETRASSQMQKVRGTGRGRFAAAGVVVLVIFGGVVGGWWAWQSGFGAGLFGSRPMPRTPEALAAFVLDGIERFDGARYSLTTTLEVREKQESTPRIDLSDPTSKEREAALERDKEKIKVLNTVLDAAQVYFDTRPQLPDSLSDLELGEDVDLTGFTILTEEPRNERGWLSVQFELPETLDMFQDRTLYKVDPDMLVNEEDKTVVFTAIPWAGFSSRYSLSEPPISDNLSVLNDMALMIPGRTSGTLTLTGLVDLSNREKIGSENSLALDVTYGDISFKFGGALKNLGDTIYGRIDNLPALPFLGIDITPIQEKWVRITKEDMASYSGVPFFFNPLEDSEESKEVAAAIAGAAKIALRAALEEGVVSFENRPATESVDGRQAYRYDLRLNAEAIAPFYTEVSMQLAEYEKSLDIEAWGDRTDEEIDESWRVNESALRYLESEAFASTIDYLNEQGSFSLSVDARTGIPLKVSSGLVMAPQLPEEGESGGFGFFFGGSPNTTSELEITNEIVLTDVNGSLNVEEPADYIELKEAVIALTGVSEFQYEVNRQTMRLHEVRNALREYHSLTGEYPAEISDLNQTSTEIYPEEPEDETKQLYYSVHEDWPFLEKMPTDVFTGEPFSYTQTSGGASYELSYTIDFPEYNGSLAQSVITHGAWSLDFDNDLSVALKLVDGVNTATPEVLSREALRENKKDSDANGVPDYLDEYVGRDENLWVYE